jgi:hypothetical protein
MSPADAAQLLGVAPDAPIQEIQHAFARQARLSHPDLLVDATDEERHSAGIRFAELREARDLLVTRKPGTPITSVHIVADGVPLRAGPMRNPWGTFLVFLLLAIVVVITVTLQDSFRSEFVQNLNGGVVEQPVEP